MTPRTRFPALTTFTNRLVGAPLDPPLERFRWAP
jgi:hypothetical protein